MRDSTLHCNTIHRLLLRCGYFPHGCGYLAVQVYPDTRSKLQGYTLHREGVLAARSPPRGPDPLGKSNLLPEFPGELTTIVSWWTTTERRSLQSLHPGASRVTPSRTPCIVSSPLVLADARPPALLALAPLWRYPILYSQCAHF